MVYPARRVPLETILQISNTRGSNRPKAMNLQAANCTQIPRAGELLLELKALRITSRSPLVGPGTRQGALAPGRAEKIQETSRRGHFSENSIDFVCSSKMLFSQGRKIFGQRNNRARRINRNRNHTILHNFLWSIRQDGPRWKRFCRFRAPVGRKHEIVSICKRPIASRFPGQANYS